MDRGTDFVNTTAFDRLARAGRPNPVIGRPSVVAGSIPPGLGDLERADREFRRALERVPRNAYATLELGAISSARGEIQEARRLLERTVEMSPQDRIAADALARVRRGRPVDVAALNRAILRRAQALVGR